MADPTIVEPEKEYLGVVCEKCGQTFPIVATPLDPTQIPPDQPLRIGARGPLHGACPHCQHRADYTADKVRRVRIS